MDRNLGFYEKGNFRSTGKIYGRIRSGLHWIFNAHKSSTCTVQNYQNTLHGKRKPAALNKAG